VSLQVFARALLSELEGGGGDALLGEVAVRFGERFREHYLEVRRAKLGLALWRGAEDESLWRELEALLQDTRGGVDWTVFWRLLSVVPNERLGRLSLADIRDAFYADDDGGGMPLEEMISRENAEGWAAWLAKYGERVVDEGGAGRQQMLRTNPAVIPRNWMMRDAYGAASGDPGSRAEDGDFGPCEELMRVLEDPYIGVEEQEGQVDERWFQRTPQEYVGVPGLSFLS
jgi:uncharacterized protein YdiU (UPF0061 family)